MIYGLVFNLFYLVSFDLVLRIGMCLLLKFRSPFDVVCATSKALKIKDQIILNLSVLSESSDHLEAFRLLP